MITYSLKHASRVFFFVLLGLWCTSFIIFYLSHESAIENENRVRHTHQVIDLINQLTANIQNAETGQRGYLLTLNEAYLVPYFDGTKETGRVFQAVKFKTQDNPLQQRRLGELEDIISKKFEELQQTINLTQAGEQEKALAIVNSDLGKNLMDEIRSSIMQFEFEERRQLSERQKRYEKAKKTGIILSFFLTILLTVVVIILSLKFQKRVLNPLLTLTKQASDYKFGEQNSFNVVGSGDEVNTLVRVLTQMNSKINQFVSSLEQAKGVAETSAKAKSIFLANMSHEIRTPLNGIYGALQILAQEKLTPKGKNILNNACSSSESLITIINDILDFSKVEAGKLEIEIASFSLPQLLEYIISDMTVIAHEKGISLTLSNQVEAEFWQGDATRIRQVVINIVSNAIKFTKKGSVVIEVKQTNNGNEILFDIEDTGIGMSQEHLSRLYERFEQADQKTSREFGGTGLGMAITRSLVNLSGGRIEVVSQLHKGSTFSVYLPLEMADSPSGISATDTFTDLNLQNKKILIAEDNQLNRIIVKEMLSSKDATIEFAENGLLAINKYKEFQPDLVLMDIQMPEMDGIEACKRIKADNPGLSIVALTANIMAEDIEKYDKAGFDDVLGKPIKQELLLKKLATYLCAD